VGSADDASLSDVVGDYLRRFLREHFPNLPTTATTTTTTSADGAASDTAVGDGDGELAVEAEWTGVLGFTSDGKPLVGPLGAFGKPHVYVAAGFCGHGMPQCFGVAKAVALMLAGRGEEVHPFVLTAARPERFAA